MPKLVESDKLCRPETRDGAESPQGESAEGGARLLIVCFIAVLAIAMLLSDRSTTIAASDSDAPVSSASTPAFTGQAWAR
jgi:hypothetical protein